MVFVPKLLHFVTRSCFSLKHTIFLSEMEKIKAHILAIDDDQAVRSAIQLLLNQHFTKVSVLGDPELLPKWLESFSPDAVILDMNFSPGLVEGEEGIQCLAYLQKRLPECIVIMITAFGDMELAVKAVRNGAFDFIIKPWSNQKLISTINAGLKLAKSQVEVKKLESKQVELNKHWVRSQDDLIGKSSQMKKIKTMLVKIAPTPANVLILGENGTGKGLIAREIHRQSDRNTKPFIHIDLGSLPETLFESELFGYKKGAFTGANESRPGRFELADGGTLFLDEVGNLPIQLQSKLLAVLQSRKVTRVGSTAEKEVDFRLITATNSPIHQMVGEQSFREDLLYRINTIEIEIPPLRERISDLPALVNHFIDLYGHKYKKTSMSISDEALDMLKTHSWPGNIRELMHAIERATILVEANLIRPEDFFFREATSTVGMGSELNLKVLEKEAMLKAMEKTAGNISQAAKELGISRVSFYRNMKKYGI